MAVQSSPSQQPLEDHLRMGQNVNTETLSMSAPKILITDMFWGGKNCGGQDLKFEIVNGPKNGKLIQEKKKENLDVKKLKVTSALTCDGKILTISYVYYQSKTGFKGKDEFTVRWTTVGNPSPGQIREKTYKIDVK